MAIMRPVDEVFADKLVPGVTPKLLLHCCCAPCASYVLDYLSPVFRITCFFYNPNIMPRGEFDRRGAELLRLLNLVEYPNQVDILPSGYDVGAFEVVAEPFSDEPEGGLRCRSCFALRLGETAARARDGGYDWFATTLSVSPHKDAAVLNEIGAGLASAYGVGYLLSDFKKRGGYTRSVALSKQYGLYRQSYCGCRLRN